MECYIFCIAKPFPFLLEIGSTNKNSCLNFEKNLLKLITYLLSRRVPIVHSLELVNLRNSNIPRFLFWSMQNKLKAVLFLRFKLKCTVHISNDGYIKNLRTEEYRQLKKALGKKLRNLRRHKWTEVVPNNIPSNAGKL